MNNDILVCLRVCRVLSKIGLLWDEEQVIKIVIVLHRSDGEKGTEDSDRKFKREGTPAAVFDVDLEVTLTSLPVLFLAACTKATYLALPICRLSPPKSCFEASLPFPLGSKEKLNWGGVGVIVLLWIGFLACDVSKCGAGEHEVGRLVAVGMLSFVQLTRSLRMVMGLLVNVALATLRLKLWAFWMLGGSERGWKGGTS